MHAINLAAVIKSDYPLVVRNAAVYLSLYDYLDVGTFLKHLEQQDLNDLVARCARITMGVDTDIDLDTMILLGGMLAQAEGNSLEDSDVEFRTSNLLILISFEDLCRKGIIEFYREKATLGNESLDETIAHLK